MPILSVTLWTSELKYFGMFLKSVYIVLWKLSCMFMFIFLLKIYPHREGGDSICISLKCWCLPLNPYGITTQTNSDKRILYWNPQSTSMQIQNRQYLLSMPQFMALCPLQKSILLKDFRKFAREDWRSPQLPNLFSTNLG